MFPGPIRTLVTKNFHRPFSPHDPRVVIPDIDLDHAFVGWRGDLCGNQPVERAVNLISTQVATLLEVARAPHLTSKGMPAN